MSIAELRKLPKAEKLQIVEALWADLIENQEDFESPPWHGVLLNETEKQYVAGKLETLDWETAKKELRNRFE